MLTRKQLGKQEHVHSTSPSDAVLVWSLFLGLLVSFGITFAVEPDLPSSAYDPIVLIYVMLVIGSFFLCLFLHRFPYGTRFMILFAMLLAGGFGLISAKASMLLPLPLAVFALVMTVLVFRQLLRLSAAIDTK